MTSRSSPSAGERGDLAPSLERRGERPGKITEERLGTIVEVEDASPDSLRKGDRKCVVEWASTGRKAGTFSAASLHLPTTEQMEKIRQLTEARA